MPRGNKRILVVDRNHESRHILTRRLVGLGVRIAETVNGQVALGLVRDGRPFDMIITELMLPKVDGLELIKGVRALHTREQLPIIVVTAQSFSQIRAQALKAGANEFFTIPLERPEDLLEAVQRHLDAIPEPETATQQA